MGVSEFLCPEAEYEVVGCEDADGVLRDARLPAACSSRHQDDLRRFKLFDDLLNQSAAAQVNIFSNRGTDTVQNECGVVAQCPQSTLFDSADWRMALLQRIRQVIPPKSACFLHPFAGYAEQGVP
jgi:hypothetical protein